MVIQITNQEIQREFIAKMKELSGYVNKTTNVVTALVTDSKAKNRQVVVNPPMVQKSVSEFANKKQYDITMEIDIYTRTTKDTVVLLDLVDDLVEEMNLRQVTTSNSNVAKTENYRVMQLQVEYKRS